jgi:Flp pilus assembly protein TadB
MSLPLPLSARLAAAYDRSRAGRRLERRLRRAMVDTTPSRWRAGQAVIALPLALLTTVVLGLGLGLGPVVALGAVRTGGRLLLRMRRGRRSVSLERAAPLLARCLSAELAAGVCAEEALAAAASSLPRADPVLRPLVGAALVRTALGEPPGSALAAAAAGEEAAGAGGLTTVAALLAVHGRAGGDPASFDRLAAALEAAVATRDDARALTAEARLAAAAVPALAGVLGVTLVLTEPAIAAGVASPLAAAMLAGCAAVAIAGTMLARRLTAVP